MIYLLIGSVIWFGVICLYGPMEWRNTSLIIMCSKIFNLILLASGTLHILEKTTHWSTLPIICFLYEAIVLVLISGWGHTGRSRMVMISFMAMLVNVFAFVDFWRSAIQYGSAFTLYDLYADKALAPTIMDVEMLTVLAIAQLLVSYNGIARARITKPSFNFVLRRFVGDP